MTPERPEPDYPRCKNTRYDHGCHPAYAKRYGGYCLECANAGVDELMEVNLAAEAELAALRDRLAAAEAELSMESGLRESWANLAIDMLHELRMDYAPGELPNMDGPKAVRKIRAARDAALARLDQMRDDRDHWEHRAGELEERVKYLEGFCRLQGEQLGIAINEKNEADARAVGYALSRVMPMHATT